MAQGKFVEQGRDIHAPHQQIISSVIFTNIALTPIGNFILCSVHIISENLAVSNLLTSGWKEEENGTNT